MPVAKKAHSTLSAGDSRDTVTVKFAEETPYVRLRGNTSSRRQRPYPDVRRRARPLLSDSCVSGSSTGSARPTRSLDRRVVRSSKSGPKHADLNLYFRFDLNG